MAYTDTNNITFNSFDSNSNKYGKKLSNNKYTGATVNDLEDIATENGGKLPTTINGLEIDWNGAVLRNANFQSGGELTINTTGELLNLINEMQKEIYVLSAAVIALSSK